MTAPTCIYCGTCDTLQESSGQPGAYACHTCINVPYANCPGCGKHITRVEVVVVRLAGQRATRCRHCTPSQKVNGL